MLSDKDMYQNDHYDKNYYDNYDELPYVKSEHWEKFFGNIAENIKNEINPKTVLDAGCAKGFLVEKLRDRGIEAFGIDSSEYAISQVDDSIKDYCKVGSILDPLDRKYDLIVCIEVIEHLFQEDSKRAIENLCKYSDDIILSSTPDGFEEKTHHNVQKPSYWTKFFAKNNFFRDTKFDASVISTWAGRYRKTDKTKEEIFGDYDDKIWELNSENQFLTNDLSKLKEIKLKEEFLKQPIGKLLEIYFKRNDLMQNFPNVKNGEYFELISWAKKVISNQIKDSALRDLDLISDWIAKENRRYEELRRLQKTLEEKEVEIRGNITKIEEFEVENKKKDEELELEIKKKDEQFQQELAAIKNGDYYSIGKNTMEFLDKNFSPRKIHGKILRKILGRMYQSNFPADNLQRNIFFQYEFYDTDKNAVEQIKSFKFQPKFSIILPVYNTNLEFLKSTIESVKNQYYSNWQLCICDDGSTQKEIKKILKDFTENDNRICVTYSEKNQGISLASNKALALAEGEFSLLLDHDDMLAKNALFEILKALNENNSLDFIYSDEDKIDEQGIHIDPFFKPDWSPNTFFSYNYPIHVSVFRTSKLKEIGGFRKGFEGSQDYDLILRYLESTNKILHIPKILYSWRQSPGSTALKLSEKDYAFEAGIKAISDALDRRKIDADCIEGVQEGTYRVRYKIKIFPLVSIIIPSRSIQNLTTCINSIIKKTTYKNYEILVLDTSPKYKLQKFCKKLKIDHFKISQKKFNFSKLNNEGVKLSKGKFVIFLNDDTEVISPDWIEGLLEHCQRDDVGIVGSKLLYKNDLVQHAGTIVGIGGFAGNYGMMHKDDGGYFFYPKIIRDCSAVTAACMMINKDLFEEIGGYDENLANSWQDVDLCIRVAKMNKKIIFTPYSLLYHFEGTTRGKEDSSDEEIAARKIFREKNRKFILNGDPYYNPNLSNSIPFMVSPNIPKAKKVLLDLYQRRYDLQKLYPDEIKINLKNLINWAATQGIIVDHDKDLLEPYYDYYFENCSEDTKKIAKKIKMFLHDKNLQNKFPEVTQGNYEKLLKYNL